MTAAVHSRENAASCTKPGQSEGCAAWTGRSRGEGYRLTPMPSGMCVCLLQWWWSVKGYLAPESRYLREQTVLFPLGARGSPEEGKIRCVVSLLARLEIRKATIAVMRRNKTHLISLPASHIINMQNPHADNSIQIKTVSRQEQRRKCQEIKGM